MTTTLGALRAPHTLISLIGAASALGAPHAGSAAAPAALQGGTLARRLAAIGPSVEWTETLLPTAAERAAGSSSDAPSAADAATAMATRIAANAARRSIIKASIICRADVMGSSSASSASSCASANSS